MESTGDPTKTKQYALWQLFQDIEGGHIDNALSSVQYHELKTFLAPIAEAMGEFETGLRKEKGPRHAGETFDFRGEAYEVVPFGESTAWKRAYEVCLDTLKTFAPQVAGEVIATVADMKMPRTKTKVVRPMKTRVVST